MCLAIPACVEQLLANENYAIVNLGDIRKEISLTLVEEMLSLGIMSSYMLVSRNRNWIRRKQNAHWRCLQKYLLSTKKYLTTTIE
jgi:hypothetical protein